MDRGGFSVEVILSLLAFKVLYPRHMHLNRGNHECSEINCYYGFQYEVGRFSGCFLASGPSVWRSAVLDSGILTNPEPAILLRASSILPFSH